MSLSLEMDAGIAYLSFDHGKANEMGRAQLEDFVAICDRLEAGEARVLVSYSRRRSRKGTPIFVAGFKLPSVNNAIWDISACSLPKVRRLGKRKRLNQQAFGVLGR